MKNVLMPDRHGAVRVAVIAVAACALAACDVLVPGPGGPGGLLGPRDPERDKDPEGILEVAACDPGNKRIHRLNRDQYDRTVRDLLLVDAAPAADFPADDVGYGFDNVADVLSTSPLLVEKLDDAAAALAELALAGGAVAQRSTFEAEVLGSTVGRASGEEWNLFSNGQIVADVTLARAGTVTLRARAREQAAGPDRARMVFRFDGADVAAFDVVATAAVYEHVLEASAGPHSFAVAFTNDFFQPENNLDRNLLVDYLEVETVNDGAASAARDRILLCAPTDGDSAACARTIFESFLRRAYRRPAAAEEVQGLVAIVELALSEGEAFDDAVRLAVHAALLSPSFLYRVELDADPGSTAPHRLSAYELASRVSYFLWSSMPDDELLAKAEDGSLLDQDVFIAELDRMLLNDKSRALTEALAGQWLQTRSLDDAQPNPERFPDFTAAVRESMKKETAHFIDAFLRDDTRPLADMMDADFTFVDATLAAWYGLPFDAAAADDEGFARVSLAGSARGGLLTQGAFLTHTSYPLRTSPVRRGKWVLEQILCMPPDPPPPEVVGQFNEDENAGTVRERLEQHRSNPDCAACHTLMDPIGFGLERFDPTGRPRDTDNGQVIDDSDIFFTGDLFHGSKELAALIKPLPELPSCVAQHLSTYATGRGFSVNEADDRCTIQDVAARATEAGGSFADIVRAVVTSDAFQKRRGEDG
jgi:hypothetical protein